MIDDGERQTLRDVGWLQPSVGGQRRSIVCTEIAQQFFIYYQAVLTIVAGTTLCGRGDLDKDFGEQWSESKVCISQKLLCCFWWRYAVALESLDLFLMDGTELKTAMPYGRCIQHFKAGRAFL